MSSAPPRIVWHRPEPFGAWLRLDDATLVAVDEPFAQRLGIDPHAAPTKTRPLELHIAVTARCPAACSGCYLDPSPHGHEPSFEALKTRLAEARDAGVSTVAFGGGEPLTRGDLGLLAEEARRLGLVPVVTLSGVGLTPERARELRSFAQVNISHDGAGDAYDARGRDVRTLAERAITILVHAGIRTGVNFVLTARSFPHLEHAADRTRELGASELQLLRYKPAGRAAIADYETRRLTEDQVSELFPTLARLVERRSLSVRIDCAMVPLLVDGLIASFADPAKTLSFWSVFGCEAARHLGGLRVDGSLAGCSFFSLTELPALRRPSHALPIAHAWEDDPALEQLRAHHAILKEPCSSCPISTVCRGGCAIVAHHEGSTLAPDPECPRVKRARASKAP